ncbi:triacylglycerol lipase [Streptomyces sp. Vc74B-19]|uniref:lipase family protein n=1 Tax=unclassified Streptomyces TaxID=2593676 RepID=UPI001BFC1A44|nr:MULTISPECIES: lipase family protein [unclassified Streptomyces]MBT3166436.1 triacylglycerol lipase [Streptomyces sp. Vc74B-19]MCO4698258.1 lipase family protein [Streptomyces sp. RO-S4]MDU0303765.1 lipase family protein [Streptomyces sp. PAL114]
MSRISSVLTTVVATTACVCASASPAAATDPVVSRGVTIPAFYSPPAELPPGNGKLIRHEPLRLGLSLPGLDGRRLPGTATRLMYTSTDANGQPVAVTGAYIEPSADWKGTGPRPLVVVGSGTMGQGDQCAPSLALENPLTLTGETLSFGYENLAVYRLLATGAAVVVTDYVGLGATDRLHTYVNRVDEGHAMLDAARVARSVPGASVTAASRVGMYGYSQGGGASASAAELQSGYAPDVPLVGTYSGAPPANLTDVTKGIDGSALAGALGWSINGFAQTSPALRAVVEANMNDAGREALEDISTTCVGDAILGYGFTKSTKWTKNGKSVGDIIAGEPAAQAVLDDQRIGRLRPTGPVRVATGVQDDIVPHGQARQMAVDWCKKGGDVTYKAVRLPNLGDKLLTNHLAPLLTDQGDAIEWLTDRLKGKATSSNCWTMPIQP